MKRVIFAIVVLLSLAHGVKAQSEIPMVTMPKNKVNIGIKAGFNSSLNYTNHLHVGETRINNVTHNFKVGYTAIVFARFNLKNHHYIQPEFSYNITKGSMMIEHSMENNGVLKDNALIKSTMHSFDLPIFYGYKFIDQRPYGMSLFLGPQIAWFWKHGTKIEYEGFYQEGIHEKLKPINFSAVLGLGVNVSNIYFDFRYEIGINDISKYIVYNKEETDEPYNNYELKIHRRRNVISFAIGVIF